MIIAVDPGKVSGIATWTNEVLYSYQEEMYAALFRLDNTLQLSHEGQGIEVETVICENYIITASTLRKTRGENWSLESIGALRYLCRRNEIEFLLQTPADAKRFMTDDKLRMLGWYEPTPGGHANDAARHLGLFIARSDPQLFKNLMRV